MLLDEVPRSGRAFLCKGREKLYKPCALFKEALWVASHCGEEKAREEEKQLLIHAGATCFRRVGCGRQKGRCCSAPIFLGVMSTWAVDTSATALLGSPTPPVPCSLHWVVLAEKGLRAVAASPKCQQLHNPGIIAHICFFSFPGLGECSRNELSSV